MQLYDFYQRTLPPTGNYALFRTSTKRHTWVDSIEGLVAATESLGAASDIYFATATFNEATQRTQVNADSKKAFYLDLDAGEKKLATQGPEKVYANRDDALADVVRFSRDTGLVPSLIVGSGEGLHLYWELDVAVGAGAWSIVAKQFQKFGAAAGLKIDSSVTADSARILRPLGTLHPNGNTVSLIKDTGKTYNFAEFAEAVGAAQALVKPPKYDLSINDEVLAIQGPPKSIKKVLQECAAARFAASNQDTVAEPYWRLMIGLAKHTLEGRDAAHALSMRHPEYNADKTDSYYDRWATGPSTCERFAEFNESACAGCKYRGKVKSPIVLGALNVEEVEGLPEEDKPAPPPAPVAKGNPWDGCIPRGFDVVKKDDRFLLVHITDVEKENEAGEMIPIRVTVPVTNEVFWLGHWSDAMHSEDTAKATVFLYGTDNKVTNFVMDQSIVASRAEMSKYLAGKGIHMTTNRRALTSMEEYVKAQLQRVKTLAKRPRIESRFGLYARDDGSLISVQGKYVTMPDGSITEALLSPALRTYEESFPLPLPPNSLGVWGPEVWKSHIMPRAKEHIAFMHKYYSDPKLARYQLAFMMGLASPLMPFTNGGYTYGPHLPKNGLTVSLYSRETGRGKSTVIESSVMAFGSPKQLNAVADKTGSTDLARLARLSLSGSLPVGMDEMGRTDPASLAGLISTIANGAARIRVTKEGGLSTSAPWALVCLIAANRSAREMVSVDSNESNAIQYRLLEIDVENMPEFSIDLREQFTSDWMAIQKCTGALGALINLAICRTGSAEIGTAVNNKVNEASRILKSVQGDRFQYRGLGAMLMVQEILERMGLAVFNTNTLIAAFRECYDQANAYIRDTVLTMNSLELLSQALHDLHAHTVVTLNDTRRTGGASTYDEPLNRQPDDIQVRHVVTQGISYVRIDALQKWANEHKVRMCDLLTEAKKLGIMRHTYGSGGAVGKDAAVRWAGNFNLMRGMRSSTGSMVSCYTFSTKMLAESVGQNAGDVLTIATATDPAIATGKVIKIKS